MLGAVQRIFNREPQQQQAASAPQVGNVPSLAYSQGPSNIGGNPDASSARNGGTPSRNTAAAAAWQDSEGESYQSSSIIDRLRVSSLIFISQYHYLALRFLTKLACSIFGTVHAQHWLHVIEEEVPVHACWTCMITYWTALYFAV